MNGTVTIRPPRRGEYGKIIDCLTETRGPGYYGARYYDDAYLSGGEVELFAAFSGGGDVMGIAGLSRGLFNEERTTGCLLTVRPQYARQGVAGALVGHFTGKLRGRGVRCVKGQAVSIHPTAQKIVEGYGWIPTGMLYGARNGKNNIPPFHGKSSLVLYTGALAVCDAGTLYINGEIAGLADTLYRQLGASAKIVQSGRNGTTVLSHFCDGHNGALYIQAAECGGDLPEALDALRGQYPSLTSMTVALNLGSPTAVPGYLELRRSGFRFCGFDLLGQYEHALFYNGEPFAEPALTVRAQTMMREVMAI